MGVPGRGWQNGPEYGEVRPTSARIRRVYRKIPRYPLANVIVALAAGAVVAAALQARVRDLGTVAPLAAAVADTPTLVPLPVSSPGEGSITRSLVLRFPQAVPAGLYEIEVRVDTYGTTPTLSAGTITIAGTCTFDAVAATLRTGDSVVFRRGAPCHLPTGPATATLSLRFTERHVQDARCALVAIPPGADAPVLDAEFNGRAYGLIGRYASLRSEATLTRAALLAFMWQRSPAFVWGGLAACVLLLAGAALLLAARHAAAIAGGLGAAAAGLALAYAILVPPLQAPDEPNHLLGYANAVGNDRLPAETERWARALHFERITFDPAEHFRPSDAAQPHPTPWASHVTPVDEISRGPLNYRYWRLLAPWLGATPPATLLTLRLVNAVVFGLTVGVAALLLSLPRQQDGTSLLVLPLLLVPTLPFFAMHMSNYALLVDGYVLIALAVAAVCHGRTDAPAVGLMLGCGTAIALGSSHSGLPMTAMLGAALAACVLARAGDGTARPRYAFWGLFVLGAIVVGVSPAGADPLAKAGVYRNVAFGLLSNWRWIAIGLGAAGLAADYVAAVLVRARSPRSGLIPARALQALAIVVALVALGSLVNTYPLLQPMETRSKWPTPAGYAGEVLRASLTLGRLSNPDWYMSSTFWAGFGWLDTYPGDWFTNLLNGATVAALVALLLTTGRMRDSGKGWRLLLVGCGAVAALAVYAAGASVQRTNIHGRYVFGLYLCGVAVCWSVLAAAGSNERRVRSLLFAAIAAIHTISLVCILGRYF